MKTRITALLLAGSRGPGDPVAHAAGVPAKAFAPVCGRPMIERVLETLQRQSSIGRILIVTDDHPDATAGFAQLARRAGVELLEQATSPAATVERALEGLSADAYPILVTTADHPLMTAGMIETLLAGIESDTDIAVGLADASVVLNAYPDSIRTVLRLGGKGYCGCNLFLLVSPAAIGGVRFWRRMERNRKKPWRLVAAAGVKTLWRYWTGRLELAAAFDRLSRSSGVRVQPVVLPQPEAAIDVDKPADLLLVERIVAARDQPAGR